MAEDESGLGREEDGRLQGQVKDLEHGVKQGGKVTQTLGRGARQPFSLSGHDAGPSQVFVFRGGLLALSIAPPPSLIFLGEGVYCTYSLDGQTKRPR